ncbi:3'-5' exonuclease [Halorhodospira halophila]|uniref:3'-5' exonuclease n=1 Tax=Halorhodospira halophila TaxID=1053 RepID=UPI00030CDEAA|nr:3'-5' exonuclease [Halorhodospira halophila]
MAREMEQRLGIDYNYDLRPDERRELRERIKGMVHRSTPRQAYQAFFDWLGRPELFRTAKRGRLEYADVFPLIYLKMRLEGVPRYYRGIKHLLIDEMQDYTPVQYAVLARLFRCPKTVLGDVNQMVNPYNSSSAAEIQATLRQALRVTLTKSYRSTYEIMQFAQRIQPDPDLEAMERHGEPPQTIRCRSHKEEVAKVAEFIEAFRVSEHNALAILTKTPKQARAIFRALPESMTDVRLLDEASEVFSTGIVVCTVPLSKGLEFDRVIVPHASAQNYASEMDRKLLYVACTRAMHRLALTYRGEPSPFIDG